MHIITKVGLTLLTAAWFSSCGQPQQSKSEKRDVTENRQAAEVHQEPINQQGVQQSKAENADENAIRQATREYQEAYNQQDAEKLAAFWASDATYVNPLTGEAAGGREAIAKLFKDKFAQNKNKRAEIKVTDIEFENPSEAVVRGVMKVTEEDQPAKKIAYAVGYVKEKGKWLVNDINEIEMQEATDNSEHLKDLAWLIGKWEDSDDNVEINFDNQWDKNKNFIIQHFNMKVYGQDDIEGRQLITWDPVNDIIRSWVFDSDGGFGEGTWKQVGKSWYANMKFTLGDGRVASSKNIYTPVDDGTYTFASVEREVDGEILPDTNPVNVEKAE